MMLLAYPIVLQAIARRRDPDEVFTVDASALAQIAFIGLASVVAGWRLARSRELRALVLRAPMRFLAAYGTLGLLSALWSERPDYTIYRALESLVFLVLVCDSVCCRRALSGKTKRQMLFAVVLAATWHLADLRFERSIEVLHNSLVPGPSSV